MKVLLLLTASLTLLSCVSAPTRETKIEGYDLNEFVQDEGNQYIQAQNSMISASAAPELFDPASPPEVKVNPIKKSALKLHLKATGFFEWPIKKARYIRGFQPFAKEGDRHFGLDLAAPKGTPVYSAKDGVVIYAGAGFTGYGKIVIIEHLNGQYATFYSHLSLIHVQEGDEVTVEDELGEVGSTGRSTGNHLHFEIRSIQDGPLDPLEFLKK
ncbi:M23 family metallopeptidase [Bdellovibrio sp. BCCA]|uniref:M23 family metallopeptidase n=1 Tax=Bdellovibrio sp. BCCA TaxID=3136281 RepID=UPI0030EFDF0C